MKYCIGFVLLVVAVLTGLAFHEYTRFTAPATLPYINLNEYWGPRDQGFVANNETVLQEIRYRSAPIERLIAKLNGPLDVQAPLLDVTGVRLDEYGFNTNFLQQFVNYWRDEYLKYWPSREVVFNRMPHFKTNIQGLDIHYLHTVATYDIGRKSVLPILLIHGWPGSVREFYEFIALLAAPDRDELDIVFEVVAPSLPGFGWSEPAQRSGMGVAEMAVLLRNLMQRLGYTRFYVHGGDWGAEIGAAVATLFPEEVIGFHSNTCGAFTPLALLKGAIAELWPDWFVPKRWQHLHFPQSERLAYTILESKYSHSHANQPETIGTALSQNPIGLAVYLYEKFTMRTRKDYSHQPDAGWSKMTEDYRNAILDNIMIYYLTNSITTSFRLKAEAFSVAKQQQRLASIPTHVPTGCARFSQDIVHWTDWQLQDRFTNLVHSTYHGRGGHFVAMEEPELLYNDFAQFVRTLQRLGVSK